MNKLALAVIVGLAGSVAQAKEPAPCLLQRMAPAMALLAKQGLVPAAVVANDLPCKALNSKGEGLKCITMRLSKDGQSVHGNVSFTLMSGGVWRVTEFDTVDGGTMEGACPL